MFRQVHVEILGVVENMSYFSCPHCEGRIDVFGHGEGRRMAQLFGVPFLGEIEIDPQIRIGGDSGKPVASMGEDAPGGKSIFAMTRNVMQRVEIRQRQRHVASRSNSVVARCLCTAGVSLAPLTCEHSRLTAKS